jgi:hypothetical protein
MFRFNVLDNQTGTIVALSEYAENAQKAVEQVAAKTKYTVDRLRAELSREEPVVF